MSQQIALLVIQIGFIILIAKLFGILAAKCHIPSVMGELIAGIVFGPYCLGSFPLPFHVFANGLFPKVDGIIGIPLDPKLYSIASLGSIILLFVSGLETDIRTFFKYSLVGTIVGIGGIVFSFICGAAVGMFVLGWDFMDPRCLFLGILCTATSVGISARILSEHHAMDSPEGVTIMAAAVIDDVLGIVCLAIVIGIANVELNGGSMAWGNIIWITVKSFGIWLGVTAVGLVLACRIAGFLKWFKSPAVFAVLAFGMALILAGLFEQAGLAMIIGAFVMGLALSKTDVAFKIRASLTPLYNFLVPIFFVVMGMLVDVRVLLDTNLLFIGLIFAIMAIIGKVVGCFVPAILMNFNSVGALRIGVGMVPRCEVVLIIAGIAAVTMMKNPVLKEESEAADDNTVKIQEQVPIFDSRLFGIAIIMPLVTALFAPPMLSAALKIKRKGVRREVEDASSVTTAFTFRTEALTNLALNELLELLRHDGFATSTVTKGIRFIQFRRD
ncbi:MAG: cation:proton antiporter, partial [Victivallales bacterium]|nr:cation:proton antiporter [Victivallales bacterium]